MLFGDRRTAVFSGEAVGSPAVRAQAIRRQKGVEVIWKIFFLLMVFSCLASFSWGRSRFFARRSVSERNKIGLAPLGTIFGVLAVGGSLFLPLPDKMSFTDLVSGGACLASLIVFWLAVFAHGSNRPDIAFSGGVPKRLVVSGVYRHIRHPFYTSYMLFWVGAAVSVPWNLLLPAPFVMGWLYWRAAKTEEERIMKSEMAGDYMAYAATTGMFLPRLRFF